MGPIDYSIDVKSPFEQSMGGFNAGLGMRENINKVKQQEQALAMQQQLQTDLAGLSRNPNAGARDFSGMMIKYPKLSEHFKRGWDTLNGEQQQNKLGVATQVYAAVNSGKPDIAVTLLNEQAVALRNSGKEEEAKAAETMAKFIEMDPGSAKTTTGLLLSSIMGPEKFAETFTKLQGETRAQNAEGRTAELHPAAVTAANEDARKKRFDADLAEIKAQYGERTEIATLAEKGWNIKKIEQDIVASKAGVSQGAERNRIAAMTAALAREDNGLKRQELQLKIDEAKTKQADAVRIKVSEIASARGSIDNTLNTVTRILKNPSLNNVLGSIEGNLPAVFSDEAADAIALIDNLKSQVFIAQIPTMKGTGALSEKEGDKLESSLQNLKRNQSEAQFRKNATEVVRLLTLGRKNLATKYGVPDTVPDTPDAAPDDKTVNDLLKKYGPRGATGTF